jgi:hypothetical protein
MALLTDEQIKGRKPVQIAFMVDDLERAALHWAETHGAGPFFIAKSAGVEDVRGADGSPAVYEHGIALGQWGSQMVELVQLYRVEPAPVAEIMDVSGFSHIAYFTEDSEAEAARLEAAGAPLLLSMNFGETRIRFHDARSTTGFIVEHYECMGAVEAAYRSVAEAAEGWDGSDPLRVLGG